ncbi:MAG: ATP-dependent Clp protease adaptor ClpS [Bacteroidia bacterium]|jgi:ATP-dependent Clp protease adaptor protein ClpS|nr:ATP-dependent Clp protease adaptor ClpS [Bacteroidia bacterium]MBP7261116.1 ATP-dependent Clp protease adaptor ClpS [Bacteroidia bacterium]MBP9180493.1 ATP-dependent Clp protease adaptor ClpS [Bacteroidia bacterium]MBP9724638.1 ATP-dependent Clp protease adaptor ClpS [Bacteroidia bacterium]
MINHAEQTEESVLDVVTTATGAFLVLHNDDVNTFDFVIECLVNVCKHDTLQAEQCALLVHYTGKAIVKSGEYDKLVPMKTALTDRGLSATVEFKKD